MIIEKKDVENNSNEVIMASDSNSSLCSNNLKSTLEANHPVSSEGEDVQIENSSIAPNGDFSKLNGHKEACLANHSRSDIEYDEFGDNYKHLKCENENSDLQNLNTSVVHINTNECLESNDSINELKLDINENQVEIDTDSGELVLDYNLQIQPFVENKSRNFSNSCEDNFNDMSENDKIPVQIIILKLTDVKTDHSEFEHFMRLYLYISEVEDSEHSFDTNSMDLIFATSDEKFNSLHNKENLSNFAYKLSLSFRHPVVPDKCYHKIKKKSIEIHLEKATKSQWGAIGISTNTAKNVSTSTKVYLPNYTPTKVFLPNKWTPCAKTPIKIDEYSPNNMISQLVKYEDPNEKLIIPASLGRGKFYGLTGLDNLGNTCFMNSVLQCMSNTSPLKDYFLSNKYIVDINHTNPLGTGGVIVKAFAQFLYQMWMGKQSSFSPNRLKSLIGEKITSMFMGFNQHDAQEFMSFFLDAIHEDLNQNKNKPKIDYQEKENDKDVKELFDESDFITEQKRAYIDGLLKEKADEMWKQYRLFNNSIVIDLFYGQFKSILTCPDCAKKSIMFDPFLYVPLPIPPPKNKYEVIFFSRDQPTGMCKSSTRFTLNLPHSSAVSELLNIISQRTNVSTRSMRLVQQQEDHMPPKFLNSNWLLADYRSSSNDSSTRNRPLLLFEVFKDENEEYIELCIIQRSLAKISSSINFMSGFHNSRVGLPFIISVKKSMLTYSYLCSVLCSYASLSVSAYRLPSSESSFGANFSNGSISSVVFHTDLFSFEKRPPIFDNNRLIPHLIYFKSSTLHTNDVLTPFVLRTPNFNGPNRNSEEIEIVPPIISETDDYVSDDSDISEDSQSSTLINSSNEENDSQDEKIDDSSDESNSKELMDEKRALFKMAEYNNDAVIDLNNIFYLSVDWIDLRNFSPKISVKLSDVECQTINELITSGDNDITLDDCLKLFNEPEVLGPQNCWRCPYCKDLREATKQLSFWRLPPILVIQLKRFKMRNVIYRDKISQFVKYPVNGLDLSKYQNGDNVISCDGQKVKPIYDLYAVVNHMGDAFMGHYTAYAKSFDGSLGWRNFDDCTVDSINESKVVTSNAYLLFYKCRTN